MSFFQNHPQEKTISGQWEKVFLCPDCRTLGKQTPNNPLVYLLSELGTLGKATKEIEHVCLIPSEWDCAFCRNKDMALKQIDALRETLEALEGMDNLKEWVKKRQAAS